MREFVRLVIVKESHSHIHTKDASLVEVGLLSQLTIIPPK